MHRPCRQLFFWIPRTCVLQCLGSWAIENVVFSYVWGVMAPMGKLVTCLGRLGRQNRIKGSRRVRPCRRSGIRSVPNLWFSSVCYAWANKTWCFAMVDGSGRSTAVVKPYTRPWHIKSQAFANFWGSGPTQIMCFLRTGQQILPTLCV